MDSIKTEAVIIDSQGVIARAVTAAKAGDRVCYGYETVRGGSLLEIGKGKISRAKKYLDNRELMSNLRDALVNYGGGNPV